MDLHKNGENSEEKNLSVQSVIDINVPLEDKDVKGQKPSKITTFYHNICFFVFGTASLIAWNAFVTNTLFFKSQLNETTEVFRFFEPSLSLCSMLSLITGNVINLLGGYKLPELYKVIGIKTVLCICFLAITIIAFYIPPTNQFFAAIMVLTIIMNVLGPMLSSALYVDVSYFPISCLTLYLAGQAFAGVFVSALSLLITLGNTNGNISAVIYFGITLAFIIFSILMYIFLIKTKWFKLFKKIATEKSKAANSAEETSKRTQYRIYVDNFKAIWKEVLGLYLTLAITLWIFPTVSIQVRSFFSGTEWATKYFISFHCFFIFNIFDFVGRYTPMFIKFPKYGSIWFFIIPLMRIVFIFLFLICFRPDHPNSVFKTVFFHDIIPIIIMAFFAISNGHFISISFGVCYTTPKGEDIKARSTLLVLALGFGLATGAFISFGFTNI